MASCVRWGERITLRRRGDTTNCFDTPLSRWDFNLFQLSAVAVTSPLSRCSERHIFLHR